jgi:hypothetical protein
MTSDLYVALLADLPDDRLVQGLGDALLTVERWLTPQQIRELCYGQNPDAEAMQREDAVAEEANEAYGWVCRYISNHTVAGNVKRGGMISAEGETPLRFAPSTPAPEIPAETKKALEAIGGTLRNGLERVRDCSATELSFLKREFIASYLRAKAKGAQ